MLSGRESRSHHEKMKRTFIILEIKSIFLVCDNFFHVYDALVVELSQNLNLSDGCDWEALLFIVQSNLLQGHHFSYHTEE